MIQYWQYNMILFVLTALIREKASIHRKTEPTSFFQKILRKPIYQPFTVLPFKPTSGMISKRLQATRQSGILNAEQWLKWGTNLLSMKTRKSWKTPHLANHLITSCQTTFPTRILLSRNLLHNNTNKSWPLEVSTYNTHPTHLFKI